MSRHSSTTALFVFMLTVAFAVGTASPALSADSPLPYLEDRGMITTLNTVPAVPEDLLPVPPGVPAEEVQTLARLTSDGSAVVFTRIQETKYLENDSQGVLAETVYRLDEAAFAATPAGGWTEADRWRVDVTNDLVFHDRVTGTDVTIATDFLAAEWTGSRIRFVDLTPDGRYAAILVDEYAVADEGWDVGMVVADRVGGTMELHDPPAGHWYPEPTGAGISDDGDHIWWVVKEQMDPRGNTWQWVYLLDRSDPNNGLQLRLDDYECIPAVSEMHLVTWMDTRTYGLMTEPPDVHLTEAVAGTDTGEFFDPMETADLATPPAWIDEVPVPCTRGGNDDASVMLTEHSSAIQENLSYRRGEHRELSAIEFGTNELVRLADLAPEDRFVHATFGASDGFVGVLYEAAVGHWVLRADLDETVPACRGYPATVWSTSPGLLRGTWLPDVIVGSPGTDVIFAGNGADLVCGGGGDDVINAGPGDDWIDGGPGDDVLRGKAGDDTLLGGLGDDRSIGAAGNDRFLERFGANRLYGGAGNDTLETIGEGASILYGGVGNDVLISALGSDELWGASGNDWAYSGRGDDLVAGGPGDDVLDDLTLYSFPDDGVFYEPTEGYDKLQAADGIDYVRGGEEMYGGNGDDTVIALYTTPETRAYGGAGNDLLNFEEAYGGFAHGGSGNDTILEATVGRGSSGDDIMTAQEWTDSDLQGGWGTDTITGGNGDDNLVGGGGHDSISGGPGDDTVVGGSGQDTLFGNEGADTIDGGNHNDVCYVNLAEDVSVAGCETLIPE